MDFSKFSKWIDESVKNAGAHALEDQYANGAFWALKSVQAYIAQEVERYRTSELQVSLYLPTEMKAAVERLRTLMKHYSETCSRLTIGQYEGVVPERGVFKTTSWVEGTCNDVTTYNYFQMLFFSTVADFLARLDVHDTNVGDIPQTRSGVDANTVAVLDEKGERDAFEQWVCKGSLDAPVYLERYPDGNYAFPVARGGWAAWFARGLIAAHRINYWKEQAYQHLKSIDGLQVIIDRMTIERMHSKCGVRAGGDHIVGVTTMTLEQVLNALAPFREGMVMEACRGRAVTHLNMEQLLALNDAYRVLGAELDPGYEESQAEPPTHKGDTDEDPYEKVFGISGVEKARDMPNDPGEQERLVAMAICTCLGFDPTTFGVMVGKYGTPEFRWQDFQGAAITGMREIVARQDVDLQLVGQGHLRRELHKILLEMKGDTSADSLGSYIDRILAMFTSGRMTKRKHAHEQ